MEIKLEIPSQQRDQADKFHRRSTIFKYTNTNTNTQKQIQIHKNKYKYTKELPNWEIRRTRFKRRSTTPPSDNFPTDIEKFFLQNINCYHPVFDFFQKTIGQFIKRAALFLIFWTEKGSQAFL